MSRLNESTESVIHSVALAYLRVAAGLAEAQQRVEQRGQRVPVHRRQPHGLVREAPQLGDGVPARAVI